MWTLLDHQTLASCCDADSDRGCLYEWLLNINLIFYFCDWSSPGLDLMFVLSCVPAQKRCIRAFEIPCLRRRGSIYGICNGCIHAQEKHSTETTDYSRKSPLHQLKTYMYTCLYWYIFFAGNLSRAIIYFKERVLIAHANFVILNKWSRCDLAVCDLLILLMRTYRISNKPIKSRRNRPGYVTFFLGNECKQIPTDWPFKAIDRGWDSVCASYTYTCDVVMMR